MTPAEQEWLAKVRWNRHEARTNLMFLMQKILGYKDVEPEVHGPIIDALPRFRGGRDEWTTTGWTYTPTVPLWEQRGKRKRLIMDPRGHLKTSVIAQAGSIQWICSRGCWRRTRQYPPA